MAANKFNDDIKTEDKDFRAKNIVQQPSSGMTPSILTTINNTSPHAPVVDNFANSNSNTDSMITRGARRANEPYESYIEDSFVGHWEREDDDPLYEYGQRGSGGDLTNGTGDDDESTLHPSTIEFDFDSFGPESIIYTPNANKLTDVKEATDSKVSTSEKPSTNDLSIGNVGHIQVKQEEQNPSLTDAVVQEEATKLEGNKTEETQANIPETENLVELSGSAGDLFESNKQNDTLPIDHIVDPTQIDLKVIEPYKKVISHAGYCHHFDPSAPAPKPGEPAPAIIVFSACYLPDRSRRDYNYVMDHLFLYVLSSLHELIADDYILIYLHNTQPNLPPTSIAASSSTNPTNGSTSSGLSSADDIARAATPHQNNLPTFSWMKRCYQMIDRKLRKNLKILYLVKPTFWLKTIVIMCKPFISSKFSKKLRFIEDMNGLRACLPLDQLILPASAESI